MSFEKKMKKRGNDKLNQFAKNPYHQEPVIETKPIKRGMPLWSKILIPTSSIAVITFVTFFITRMAFTNFNNATDGAPRNEDACSVTPASPSRDNESPTGNGDSIVNQFPNVDYSDHTYITYPGQNSGAIGAQYIDYKIDENVTVIGRDYIHNEDLTTEVNVYHIKNINEEAGIAVQFKGSEEYYAYVCSNYLCETYDELFDQMGFDSEMVLKSATYCDINDHTTSGAINKQDDLKNLLSSYKTKNLNNIYPNNPNVPQEGKIESVIISFSIPCLDIKTAYLEFYNYGLLSIRLSNALPHTFDVGENEYNTFVEVMMSAME